MSILFTVGLPGQGKGLVNMREIQRKLENTKRHIVTSMTEIEMDKLVPFIEGRFPKDNLRVPERMHFIEKDKVSQFYRYRGRWTLPPPPRIPRDVSDEEKDRICEEYFKPITEGEPMYGGVEYHLTEAHRHFRSEKWSEMGHLAIFYLTQHRHFDDNVVIETQLPKQVIVQMRDLGEECWEMSNHYKQRMGWFAKPGCISIKKFYRVPKTESAEPYATETFKIDPKGIAGCYRTRGAVGIGGSTPETIVAKKALPFWMIPVLAVGVVVAACAGLWLLPKVVMGGLGKLMKSTTEATEGAFREAIPFDPLKKIATAGTPPTTAAIPSGGFHVEQKAGVTEPAKPEVWAVGYVAGPKGVIVELSDGSRRSTVAGVVENIQIKGQSYTLKRPLKVPPSEPLQTPAKKELTPTENDPKVTAHENKQPDS